MKTSPFLDFSTRCIYNSPFFSFSFSFAVNDKLVSYVSAL